MDVVVDHSDPPAPVVMRVVGEVDIYTSAMLRQELSVLMSSRQGDLIVDLTDVDFFDSTGLGVLIRAARQVHDRGSQMALVIHRSRVVDLKMTALGQTFRVHRTLAEARASLTGRGPDGPPQPAGSS